MAHMLSLTCLVLALLYFRAGIVAGAAAAGDWGAALGELLGPVLLFYAVIAVIRVIRRWRTGIASPVPFWGFGVALFFGLSGILGRSDITDPFSATVAASLADEDTCHRSHSSAAIDACTRLIQSNSFSGRRQAVIFNDRGLHFYNDGALEQAVADFDRALSIDGELAPAWYNRALAKTRLKQLDRAVADFSRAITLNPDRAEIWASRCAAYSMQGKMDSAITDCSRAISLAPKLAVAWGTLGSIYAARGDLENAVSNLEEAVRLDPGNEAFSSLLEDVRRTR